MVGIDISQSRLSWNKNQFVSFRVPGLTPPPLPLLVVGLLKTTLCPGIREKLRMHGICCNLKVIVTVKSIGYLQIGFRPLNSSYSNLKVLTRSQVCLFCPQSCPYKLQILADFIANFNVFSSFGHTCERFKTFKFE